MEKKKWSTQKMIYTAMLAALGGVLMSLEISVPMMPPFYKLDFSDVPSIIALFLMGPASAPSAARRAISPTRPSSTSQSSTPESSRSSATLSKLPLTPTWFTQTYGLPWHCVVCDSNVAGLQEDGKDQKSSKCFHGSRCCDSYSICLLLQRLYYLAAVCESNGIAVKSGDPDGGLCESIHHESDILYYPGNHSIQHN